MRCTVGCRRWALIAVAGLALSGCGFGTQGLAFSNDHRLKIVSPADREQVRLPVTVDWTIDDFEVTGPGPGSGSGEGYFAVFVDTPVVPPGESLDYVARKDGGCRPRDGCPDKAYLDARRVFTTTDTELVVDNLPKSGRDGRREFHEAIVVLLSPAGRRIGESAWHVRFELKRGVA